MKKLLYFSIAIAFLPCIMNCGQRNKEAGTEASHSSFWDSASGVFMRPEKSWDTIGYVAGHFLEKDRVDSIYCIALGTSSYNESGSANWPDNAFNCYLFSNEYRKVPPLYLSGCYGIDNVKVHDLDNDGLDEIGMVHYWWIGWWTHYVIFDLEERKWERLNSIGYYLGYDRDMKAFDVARPSDRTGYFWATEDKWIGEDIVTQEKLFKIEREPIEYVSDTITCYALPGGKPIIVPLNYHK